MADMEVLENRTVSGRGARGRSDVGRAADEGEKTEEG